MARPRVFIRVVRLSGDQYRRVERGGQEIHGLSYNKATGECYSIDDKIGRRVYWGRDIVQAISRYRASLHPPAITPVSDDTAYGSLIEAGVSQEVVDQHPELVKLAKQGRFSVSQEWIDRNPDSPLSRVVKNSERKKKGLPPMPIVPGQPEPETHEPSKKRLSDALKEWERWTSAKSRSRYYIAEVSSRFQEFRRVVGNKRISEVTSDDFAEWRLWVAKASLKHTAPGKWSNVRHQNAKTVLKVARKNQKSWGWPDGIMDWAGDYDSEFYKPDKANRARMPVDVFRRLLEITEQWKQTDPKQYSATSQRGRAQRLQAELKQREGHLWSTVLKLAVNCSLDNVDCTRIQWDNIKNLDSALPYMDFPRQKTKHTTGEIDRRTPLLPPVGEALKQWRERQPYDGVIFRTARGGPFAKTSFYQAFTRLAEAAGTGEWTFKHIRNIASSLGKLNKLSRDERDAVLGHVVDGTSKFYEEDVDHRYLIRLVNLVGKEYFDGAEISVGSVDHAHERVITPAPPSMS